ncbi:MAG: glycosyltransferase [Clostridia bacterium]|nr:glycosyltransferase [Clostridia bacterium]
MKVLLVLDSFYPNVDGPVNVIVNIAKILNEKKLAEVELLVPSHPKDKREIDGVKIHRCPTMAGPEGYRTCLPSINCKVRKIIKKGGYDLIHVHSPFPLGKYAIKKAKKYKIPNMITVHTKYKSDFERKLKSKFLQNFMMRFIMKPINKADYVLSVSNGAGQVVKEYGYKGETVHIIRNGTDLVPQVFDEQTIANIKNEYDLENKFVFLFVGRIVENKNIQFSLEVLKKLKQDGVDNFKFLIVGAGNYVDKLKKLAKEYNLEDNVVFAGKIMDRNKLAAIYASSDLFMFPSDFDTCGIVAIEAAANGTPSAMLENTCASEVIHHLENGLSLPNDSTIWKNEIKKVMQDKQLHATMKQNASKNVYVHWNDIVLQYYDFYKKVLNKEI